MIKSPVALDLNLYNMLPLCARFFLSANALFDTSALA
jgi:hypothetical protein